MYFELKFTSYSYISESIGEFGLDMVDVVREEIGIPDFPIDNIDLDRQACYMTDGTCLTEKLARKIGLFNGINKLIVHVPSGFLTKFKKWEIVKKYKDDTGVFFWKKPRITCVDLGDKICWNDVIDEWMSAGCPIYWGITKEEYDIKEDE